jgi:SLOG cluster2
MIPERPLAGCIVGISTSESEELESLGFDRFEVNRAVIRLSEALLGAGARLAFGHDWRPGGVMEAVAALAVRYFDLNPVNSGPPPPPILNRVAPPDVPFLHSEGEARIEAGNTADPAQILQTRLRGIVDAEQVKVPANVLEGLEGRKRALTALRQELAQICDARVCLGGKLTNFSGRMPGVVEEGVYTVALRRPLYVSEIFGGAAQTLANALDRPRAIFDFVPPQDESWRRWDFAPGDSLVWNGLIAEESHRLRGSKSVDACIELIFRGVIRWWRENRRQVLNERREKGWIY